MKDFLGNTLEVGDTVVYILPQYRELGKGKILRFTDKFVILEVPNRWNNTLKQTSDQLIKIASVSASATNGE